MAYVDPATGTGSVCSLTAPCKKVSDALATARPYVKLKGTIDEAVTINNQNVKVLADPGAKLTRTSAGVILRVDGTSAVEIVDLVIADGLGGTGIGISLPPGNTASLTLQRSTVSNNAGGGISASGGTLTVTQSAISGNPGGGIIVTGGSVTISRSTISGNVASGVSISGSQFDITNSIIASNGGPAASIGGVRFDQTNSGTRRFEFNTVTNNNGIDGAALGVVCTLVGQPVTFSNNIVYANQVGGTRTQVGGANCNWHYSDIGPVALPDTGNISADPLFTDPTRGNFHLQFSSPAIDAADPGATANIDIDGDVRPLGNGRDMGADEEPVLLK